MVFYNSNSFIIFFFLCIELFTINNFSNNTNEILVQAVSNNSSGSVTDIFGVVKIYQTVENGTEWYINMTNPFNDDFFSISYDNLLLRKQNDNSWQIGGSEVKFNVNSTDKKLWKNVEITGYVKVLGLLPFNEKAITEDFDKDYEFSWIARSGKHSSSTPCDGTALVGSINVNGSVSWKKEIWHTGGYTGDKDKQKITDSILNRWIGWKTVVYNTGNDSAVKMESYIDNKNSGYWTKASEIMDNGNWNAKNNNQVFYKINCSKKIDQILADPKPYVTFRADNIIWDFKNLSVREIDPNKMIYNAP